MSNKDCEIKEDEVVNLDKPKYSKQQLLKSMRYFDRQDLLGAILDDGKEYTISEVDSILGRFMKGKVK